MSSDQYRQRTFSGELKVDFFHEGAPERTFLSTNVSGDKTYFQSKVGESEGFLIRFKPDIVDGEHTYIFEDNEWNFTYERSPNILPVYGTVEVKSSNSVSTIEYGLSGHYFERGGRKIEIKGQGKLNISSL